MIIKNGSVNDAVNREAYVADIRITDGKIAEIGRDLTVNEGEEVIDATGLNVYPGFVEAHCHLGLDGYGIGFEGADYNEPGDICTLVAVDTDRYRRETDTRAVRKNVSLPAWMAYQAEQRGIHHQLLHVRRNLAGLQIMDTQHPVPEGDGVRGVSGLHDIKGFAAEIGPQVRQRDLR